MKNRHLYPKDWKQISLSVRSSAQWRCQQCDRPCRRPREPWVKFLDRLTGDDQRWQRETSDATHDDETGEWGYVDRPTRFVLTVAHLDHNPANCDPDNLKALCAPCHLRYDAKMHAIKAGETRSRKRQTDAEVKGQLSLF